ncbi:MAG: WD40 repeat domain-containing protein [Pyrinomonadaceae bacterium]
MKITLLIFVLLFSFVHASAADDPDILKFKGKIGFTKGEDKILGYRFFEGGKRFLLIGEKSLQIWDVETAKLLKSMPHQLSQFGPRGFFSKYVLLGIPQLIDLMTPYLVDPDGKWIALIEKIDDKTKAVVVRDLRDLKQIKVLRLPNVSVEYIHFDEQKSEINVFGITSEIGDFAVWDRESLDLKRVISINGYKWHKLIRNEEKMIVGTGDTETSFNLWDLKHGSQLTLRDVKTGAIEKTFAAENLEPRTSFQKTTISPDERFMMSERNNRYFVWEIDGGRSSPRFEVSAKNDGEDLSYLGTIGGRFMIFSADKKLYVYDFAGNGLPKYVLSADAPKDSVQLFDKTTDGKYIVVGEDEKISVLETGGDGKPLFRIVRDSEKERFTTVKFVSGENLLAVGRVNSSEKKPERTEFYDAETGRLEFTVPFGFDPNISFTPDKNYIVSRGLGSVKFWNVAEKKFFFIGLEVHYPDSSDMSMSWDSPYNKETVAFSPDFKFSLRYGDDVVAVFDNEKGDYVESLFDRERVKYNKKNKVKKSGLGDAGWSPDGKTIYALDEKSRTVNLWEVGS